MKTPNQTVALTPMLKATLQDWPTLVQDLKKKTLMQLLVSTCQNYIQYTDTCTLVSGELTPGLDVYNIGYGNMHGLAI